MVYKPRRHSFYIMATYLIAEEDTTVETNDELEFYKYNTNTIKKKTIKYNNMQINTTCSSPTNYIIC